MPPKKAVQKVVEQKPFRYAALPRELQTTLASFLDFATLKSLSLTRKSVRTTLYPVLFKSISAAHLAAKKTSETIASPPGTQHTQNMSFSFDIVNEASATAFAVRNATNLQLGLLPGLCSLRTVTFDFRLGANLDIFNLERSYFATEAMIKAIIACAEQARFSLNLVGKTDISSEDALSLLVAILRPFRTKKLEKINFKDMLCGEALDVTVSKGEAFRVLTDLAPTLRELTLRGPSWLAWYEDPFPFANLQRLELHYGELYDYEEESVMTIMRSIPALIQSCGDSLTKLRLVVDWEYDDTNVALARSVLSGVNLNKLTELRLGKSVFLYVHDWLHDLQLKLLHIDMLSESHWSTLAHLLRDHSTALNGLRTAHLYYDSEDGWTEDAAEHYSAICLALQSRGAQIRFYVTKIYCYSLDAMKDFIDDFHEQVVTLSLSLPELEYELECSGELYIAAMDKLTELTLKFDETLNEDTAPRSAAFAFLLARLTAPKLQVLKLEVTTPYVGHLQALVKAISAKKFPKLRSIKGYLRLGKYGEEWYNSVRAVSQKRFLEMCEKKKISVQDLVWKTV